MKVCVLGTGNMGSALALGILRGRGAEGKDLILFDKTRRKALKLAREAGAKVARDAGEAVGKSDAVVVAVKPKAVEGLLREVYGEMGGKLVISIAATVPLAYIEKRIPKSARAAVLMPSLSMQRGRGVGVFCIGKRAKRKDAENIKRLLEGAGRVMEVRTDELTDLALISASGPAFFYLVIDAMAGAGQRGGLGRKNALELAAAAAEGAGEAVLEGAEEPSELIARVATKGGTTEAGLKVLKRRRVADAVKNAMSATLNKARRMRRAWK